MLNPEEKAEIAAVATEPLLQCIENLSKAQIEMLKTLKEVGFDSPGGEYAIEAVNAFSFVLGALSAIPDGLRSKMCNERK